MSVFKTRPILASIGLSVLWYVLHTHFTFIDYKDYVLIYNTSWNIQAYPVSFGLKFFLFPLYIAGIDPLLGYTILIFFATAGVFHFLQSCRCSLWIFLVLSAISYYPLVLYLILIKQYLAIGLLSWSLCGFKAMQNNRLPVSLSLLALASITVHFQALILLFSFPISRNVFIAKIISFRIFLSGKKINSLLFFAVPGLLVVFSIYLNRFMSYINYDREFSVLSFGLSISFFILLFNLTKVYVYNLGFLSLPTYALCLSLGWLSRANVLMATLLVVSLALPGYTKLTIYRLFSYSLVAALLFLKAIPFTLSGLDSGFFSQTF